VYKVGQDSGNTTYGWASSGFCIDLNLPTARNSCGRQRQNVTLTYNNITVQSTVIIKMSDFNYQFSLVYWHISICTCFWPKITNVTKNTRNMYSVYLVEDVATGMHALGEHGWGPGDRP